MAGTLGQQLLKAAEGHDPAPVKALLAQGAPVDGDPVDPESQLGVDSPLVRAACFGRVDVARALLKAGADVNRRGQYGRTPLSYAVTKSLALTELLLAHHPELMGRSDSENSVVDEYLFHAAYDDLDPRILDRLLDAGFDLSSRGARYAAQGRSPLALAVSVGHLPSVERLLAAGLDPNEGGVPGQAVFTELARVKSAEAQRAIFTRLLDAGLVPTVSTHFSKPSALMLAAQLGDVVLVRRCLEGGADANATSFYGSALLSACELGHLEVVRLLLDRGASVELGERESPLLVASRGGHVEVARLLLDRGADPNRRCAAGTALTVAEGLRNPALVDLLLERGAKPEQPTLDASTAAALDAARAAAERDPTSPSARLAWARALLGQGYRAAAFCELRAATRLGAVEPADLRAQLTFDNPSSRRWSFVDFLPEPTGVAPAVTDARFPGARVVSGVRVLPLVIVLGRPCLRCDEAGTVECSTCEGRGSYSSFLDPDHDVECDPRMACPSCGGALKYVVAGGAFGAGPCAHPAWALEWQDADTTLERCGSCGLARLKLRRAAETVLACGVCGHLDCVCRR